MTKKSLLTKKTVLTVIVALVVLLLLIQLVPYGRSHTNPPVTQEPNWDSPQTEALARTACFDCHSNEVVWPWYSNVAPFSWLAQRDVDEGRSRLNFSEMDKRQNTREIVEIVLEGEMPPLQYTLIHKNARLSAADRQALADGFRATFGR